MTNTTTRQNKGTSSPNKDKIKRLSEQECEAKLDRLMYLAVHLDNVLRLMAVARGKLLIPGVPLHHEMRLVKDQVHVEIRKIRHAIKEAAC